MSIPRGGFHPVRHLAGGIYRVPGFQGDKQVFLESFAQAGVATSEASTSGIVTGGGSLVFPNLLAGVCVRSQVARCWHDRRS